MRTISGLLAFALLALGGCAPRSVAGLPPDVVDLDATWASDLYCVVDADGGAGCFHQTRASARFAEYVPLPLAPSVRAVQVRVGERPCVLLEDGRAECFRLVFADERDLAFHEPRTVAEGLRRFDVGDRGLCTIDTDEVGRCGEVGPIGAAVDVAASTGCVLDRRGDVTCEDGVVPASRTGGLVALASDAPCGTDAEGRVVCWRFEGASSRVRRRTDGLDASRDLRTDDGRAGCAVSRDGELVCWGRVRSSLPRIGDGDGMRRVELGAPIERVRSTRYADCVLFEDGAVECWQQRREVGLGGG